MDFQRPALTLSARNKDISLSVKCDGHVQQAVQAPFILTEAPQHTLAFTATRRPHGHKGGLAHVNAPPTTNGCSLWWRANPTSSRHRKNICDEQRNIVTISRSSCFSSLPVMYLLFIFNVSNRAGCIGLLDLCDVCLLLCVGLTWLSETVLFCLHMLMGELFSARVLSAWRIKNYEYSVRIPRPETQCCCAVISGTEAPPTKSSVCWG